MENSNLLDDATKKILSVIEYLSSLAGVNTITVRDISAYHSTLWFADIPHNPTHCYVRSWGADENTPDDVWMDIKKLPEPPLPSVPKICEAWLDEQIIRKIDSAPRLKSSLASTKTIIDQETLEEIETIEKIFLEDNPVIQSAWDTYLQQKWLPWTELYKRYQEVQKVFGGLFSIYQEQQRLGEQYELVVSLGLLTWKQPAGHSVRRHLLVAKASLEFEASIGRFVVKAAPDGDQAELELDMLEPESIPPNSSSLINASRSLRDNLWDRTIYDSLLSSVANSLEKQGRGAYGAETVTPSGAAACEIPLIEYAPALILRKRSQKGLLEVLSRIHSQVESGADIPEQFLDLCEVRRESEGIEHEDQSSFSLPETIFFPLPANDQQRQIINKYNRQNGVLVQGPPGTGKSQTIANLICHLLATNQRILVTAKTARALEVLHEKIPAEVSPLCISMLGSGTEERESLERSVSGILAKINTRIESVDARKIAELEERLYESRKAKAEAEQALVALREKETFEHTVADGAYSGTAAVIAQRITEHTESYNWFTDTIKDGESLPLNQQEIGSLHSLLKNISPEQDKEYSAYLPDPGRDITDSEELRSLWRDVDAYEQTLEQSKIRLASLSGRALLQSGQTPASMLHDSIGKLLAGIHSVLRRPFPWLNTAVKEVLADLDTPWRQLMQMTSERLSELKPLAVKADKIAVEMPSGASLRRVQSDAQILHDHFAGGGGLKQFGFFEHPLVKKHGEIIKQVRVDGLEALDKNLLSKLITYAKVHLSLDEIWSLWGDKVNKPAGKHPLMQVAEIEEYVEALEHLLQTYDQRSEVLHHVEQITGLPRPRFEDFASLDELQSTCMDVVRASGIKTVYQRLQNEEGHIAAIVSRTDAHPLCGELGVSFKQKDADQYLVVVNKIQQAWQMAEKVQAKKKLLKSLYGKAPEFTKSLIQGPDHKTAHQRLLMLDKAWAWQQASSWLHTFTNQDNLVLERNIRRHDTSAAKALEELAALHAWQHCFERMTKKHQEHLVSWHQSMRRLGKGTGKHAHKHRLDAQKSLNECKSAVPAWIMPLHRVFETVEAGPGCFDVIIVDEASQCGFEALPLLYLAKKIIVVGDEKQISPEAVGINRDHVFSLMKTYLSPLKHSASFDIENSLFGHGQIRFGNRVTLCEHFRCAPEIIRFSNELCYTSDPLVPLKQVPPNRLVPLKAIHVPSGFREGSGQSTVNRPEAEELVSKIIECCGDNSYAGMTMGVIVLQGETQAKIIEDMLMKRLGTAEMQERRLLCGNPYSFQGDERDVIFVSMVAAPNQRIGALTQEKDERRFNVAASRAKEQMWLFHSVTANNLSATCLRRRLLNHFYDASPKEIAGIAVDELQRQTHAADKWREQAPYPFDSWFEVDVALQIANRGYSVVPQFEFAGKRIDLVVQGGSAQLAVECDGDHWHGRDQYEADMQRQRMLERCNWVFFRVRESAYRINKEKALEGLWPMLDSRGIYPRGAEPVCDIPDNSDLTEQANTVLPVQSELMLDAENSTEEGCLTEHEQECDEAIDDDGTTPSFCPASIQDALTMKPSELKTLIVEIMKTLPNNSCVRDALSTIILKKCKINTRGTPRTTFTRKVEGQVANMIRSGHLVAYKSKNERLKLGWVELT